MCGLEAVEHGPSNLEDRIIQDINRALEAVGESNPNCFYQVRPDQAEMVRPPTQVTVTVVQYSKTITFVSGYDSSWMPGNAIQITGDNVLNRIEDEASPSAPVLTQPYEGASGTYTATVYNDWIMLPANVRQIMDPVSLDKSTVLIPAQSASDLNLRLLEYNKNYDRRYAAYVMALQKSVLEPTRYYPFAQMFIGTLRAGIMLDTLPGAARKLVYDARKTVFAPVTTLSDTRTTLMPQAKDFEILLPVARWFFSSYQMCSIPKTELEPEYSLAMQKARELSIFGNRAKRFLYNPNR